MKSPLRSFIAKDNDESRCWAFLNYLPNYFLFSLCKSMPEVSSFFGFCMTEMNSFREFPIFHEE